MIVDFLTTTRADYGALRPVLKKMDEAVDFETRVLVTGTHLSEEFGLTYKMIEDDGFRIGCKIEILSDRKGNLAVSDTMANAIKGFAEYFENDPPDFLFVDGDRYETLAVCLAAVNKNIPIVHLGGGATTEGAQDEYYRHAITKLSYVHLATTEVYKQRIIQMGEDPSRVFMVGSPLIENILNTVFMSKQELEESISFKLDMPYAVVTFHPVTLENQTVVSQIRELLSACRECKSLKYIFTFSNADNGGTIINEEVRTFVKTFDRAMCIPSLGARRYYSALKYAACVIGNSSSGIIEVPSFHIPTVNIGDRQRGRIQADSIINCVPEKEEILRALNWACDAEFFKKCQLTKNPNGDGNSSEKIIKALRNIWNTGIDRKKSFYDISVMAEDV